MFGKSIEQLQAELERLGEREVQLISQQRDAAAQAIAAELTAGTAVLDATPEAPADAAVEQLHRARSAGAAVEAALRACRVRRTGVLRDLRATKAASLHKQAAELRNQREKVVAKIQKLEAAAGELQGVPCTVRPVDNFGGRWPLTAQLEGQANSAEEQASRYDAELPRDGSVDAEGVDVRDLLLAVLKVESDAPSSTDIIRWSGLIEREGVRSADLNRGLGFEKKSGPLDFGQHPRRFHLRWSEGRIDLAESYIQCAPLAITLGSSTLQGSDVFRAPQP